MTRYFLLLVWISSPAFADGYLNPEFAGRSFKSILVTVPVEDLSFRERTEKATLSYLKKYAGSVCMKSLDLFPPIAEVSNDDYTKKLNEARIEAVLSIEPADSRGSFPPNYRHASTTFSMAHVGTRHNRSISASITLYDVQTGKTVWVLPIAFTDEGHDIIKGLSARIVSRLRNEKLLLAKPKEPSWFSKIKSDTKKDEQKAE